MPAPRLHESGRVETCSYCLPPDVIEAIEERAKREGISRSRALVLIVQEWRRRDSQ